MLNPFTVKIPGWDLVINHHSNALIGNVMRKSFHYDGVITGRCIEFIDDVLSFPKHVPENMKQNKTTQNKGQ